MTKQFIRLLADVTCTWTGANPTYRVYVDQELFAERTWIWTDSYLEECLQIEAEPGEYRVCYELVSPHQATVHVKNLRVDHGPGTVENHVLRITQ